MNRLVVMSCQTEYRDSTRNEKGQEKGYLIESLPRDMAEAFPLSVSATAERKIPTLWKGNYDRGKLDLYSSGHHPEKEINSHKL
jgi:hypothetical protein